MANNREISQFAGLVTVNDTTNEISIGSSITLPAGSKIGISTSSAGAVGATLHVSGSGNDGGFVLIDGVAQPRLDFRSSDSSKKIYSFTNESNANRLRIGTLDGDYTNFQYIATVSAGGSFGIGLGNATPERKLDVEDSGANGTVIRSKVTTNNGGYLAYEALDSSDNQVFYVSHNGRIGADEGIIFGSDTATANVLDDYEEGTAFTSLNGTTTNPSGLSWNGTSYYTKIGRFVYFNWGSNNSTWSSAGTGDFYIQVPFACANINSPTFQPMHGISIVHHNGFFNVTNVIAKIEQNSNRVYFYQTGSNTPLTWSNVVQSKFVSMQLTYNTET